MEKLLTIKKQTELELRRSKKAFESRFNDDNYRPRKRYYGLATANANRKFNSGKSPKRYYSKDNRSRERGRNVVVKRRRSRSRDNSKLEIEYDNKNDDKKSYQNPIVKEKIIEQPRPVTKFSEVEMKRNKRFLSLMCNHIKKAKKDLKEESKSTAMKNRFEMEQRVNEAITKDRLEFKKEYQKKRREKAELWLKRKERRLRNLEDAIERKKGIALIEKITKDSNNKSPYILTDANPPIFYLPKIISPKIQEKLKTSQEFQELVLKKEVEVIRSKLPEKVEFDEKQNPNETEQINQINQINKNIEQTEFQKLQEKELKEKEMKETFSKYKKDIKEGFSDSASEDVKTDIKETENEGKIVENAEKNAEKKTEKETEKVLEIDIKEDWKEKIIETKIVGNKNEKDRILEEKEILRNKVNEVKIENYEKNELVEKKLKEKDENIFEDESELIKEKNDVNSIVKNDSEGKDK